MNLHMLESLAHSAALPVVWEIMNATLDPIWVST